MSNDFVYRSEYGCARHVRVPCKNGRDADSYVSTHLFNLTPVNFDRPTIVGRIMSLIAPKKPKTHNKYWVAYMYRRNPNGVGCELKPHHSFITKVPVNYGYQVSVKVFSRGTGMIEFVNELTGQRENVCEDKFYRGYPKCGVVYDFAGHKD